MSALAAGVLVQCAGRQRWHPLGGALGASRARTPLGTRVARTHHAPSGSRPRHRGYRREGRQYSLPPQAAGRNGRQKSSGAKAEASRNRQDDRARSERNSVSVRRVRPMKKAPRGVCGEPGTCDALSSSPAGACQSISARMPSRTRGLYDIIIAGHGINLPAFAHEGRCAGRGLEDRPAEERGGPPRLQSGSRRHLGRCNTDLHLHSPHCSSRSEKAWLFVLGRFAFAPRRRPRPNRAGPS